MDKKLLKIFAVHARLGGWLGWMHLHPGLLLVLLEHMRIALEKKLTFS